MFVQPQIQRHHKSHPPIGSSSFHPRTAASNNHNGSFSVKANLTQRTQPTHRLSRPQTSRDHPADKSNSPCLRSVLKSNSISSVSSCSSRSKQKGSRRTNSERTKLPNVKRVEVRTRCIRKSKSFEQLRVRSRSNPRIHPSNGQQSKLMQRLRCYHVNNCDSNFDKWNLNQSVAEENDVFERGTKATSLCNSTTWYYNKFSVITNYSKKNLGFISSFCLSFINYQLETWRLLVDGVSFIPDCDHHNPLHSYIPNLSQQRSFDGEILNRERCNRPTIARNESAPNFSVTNKNLIRANSVERAPESHSPPKMAMCNSTCNHLPQQISGVNTCANYSHLAERSAVFEDPRQVTRNQGAIPLVTQRSMPLYSSTGTGRDETNRYLMPGEPLDNCRQLCFVAASHRTAPQHLMRNHSTRPYYEGLQRQATIDVPPVAKYHQCFNGIHPSTLSRSMNSRSSSHVPTMEFSTWGQQGSTRKIPGQASNSVSSLDQSADEQSTSYSMFETSTETNYWPEQTRYFSLRAPASLAQNHAHHGQNQVTNNGPYLARVHQHKPLARSSTTSRPPTITDSRQHRSMTGHRQLWGQQNGSQSLSYSHRLAQNRNITRPATIGSDSELYSRRHELSQFRDKITLPVASVTKPALSNVDASKLHPLSRAGQVLSSSVSLGVKTGTISSPGESRVPGSLRESPKDRLRKTTDDPRPTSVSNPLHDGSHSGKNKSLAPDPSTRYQASPSPSSSKKSSRISLAGAKRRLGFKQKGLSSLSIYRSEEVLPRDLTRQQQQDLANSNQPQYGPSSTSDSSNEPNGLGGHLDGNNGNGAGANGILDPTSCFVEGLGVGQIASRQALVSPYMGDILLSLSERRGMLEVEVVRARRLQSKAGAKRMPSPYVKVYLMKNKKCVGKFKTPQAKRTLDPLYQQQFIFRDDYTDCVLQVIVWGDYGKRDHKSLMGIVQIHLKDVDISSLLIGWYRLFNAPSMANCAINSSKVLRQTISSTNLGQQAPILAENPVSP